MRIIVNQIIGITDDGKQLHLIEAYGSSDETKPTEATVGGPIVDGSFCMETDTAKGFFFNEEAVDWIEA